MFLYFNIMTCILLFLKAQPTKLQIHLLTIVFVFHYFSDVLPLLPLCSTVKPCANIMSWQWDTNKYTIQTSHAVIVNI